MEITGLREQSYDIGKCVVMITDRWDGTTNLFADGGPLTHLGTTEGEVQIAPNPEYSELTLPEALGPSALKRYLTGTRPTFSLGMFADLEQMKAVSPTGLASMGQERQILDKTYTLWIVPEALFLKPNALGFSQPVPVVLTSGVWLKDGVALTTEEERLLHLSSLIWKADFAPLGVMYKHEEGGKALTTTEVTVQHDLDRPEGCQQVLVLGEYFGDYPAFSTASVPGLDFEPV
jgi:hypothetical protein